MSPLAPGEAFRFSCSAAVPCFNQCCRDLNQFLTPYDILRLKNALGLSSTAFLERYTARHSGPRSGLPVITLKPADPSRLTCPFVTPGGCAVYADRPASCRIYPLARAVTRSRETGRLTEHYALVREPHCRGHESGSKWTARDWIADQGLTGYLRANDRFLDIIALKNRRGPAPLDLTSMHRFHTALYDLDAFRAHLSAFGFPEAVPPDTATEERLMTDDLALLFYAHRWIGATLSGESPD